MLKLGMLIVILTGLLFVGFTWELLYFMLAIVSLYVLLSGHYEFIDFSYFGNSLGGGLLSTVLVWLSTWIIMLMMLASLKVIKHNELYFLLIMLSMLIFLSLVFLSIDLIWFYISFEAVLIPTYLLIIGWGYQPERLQAGLYLIFYTMFVSLPLLVVILWVNAKSFNLMNLFSELNWFSSLIFLGGVGAFLVKMPMFFVHLWLPKAHVEAPVSGSMVLAGILLKMGGFGLYRISEYFMFMVKSLGMVWMSISLVGGLYMSLVCLRQSDLKSLIAYSSVVHMGLVIGGLMTMSWVGLAGAFILMVGHGLCSSGLFCLANINYERLHSRSVLVNKGLINLLPSGALMWFLLVSSNMAAPMSLNLIGEISLLGCLLSYSAFMMFILVFLSFFSAAYCLYLYSSIQHGSLVKGTMPFYEMLMVEYLVLLLHWIPLNILFMKMDFFAM
uniref:NADH-ubiquinone oxidoreductase chain 4 n=1 Tax=Tropostreptus sigmatospinus TaxID=2931685 RepID=A0A8T9JAW3_9MYRI|nr:NADH dehydrogenase subunit 4 [Tropostreptus sigmatospinus]UOF70176.1 NADH dehydrogenase subunit 4 [Tropostreptus sigmatospinus]UOF70254.1 NADH dehydrogenase subunit 4 [Tropostreptus sigmatospinus]